MKTPKWADDLMKTVCKEYGKPEIELRFRRPSYSRGASGICYEDHISITVARYFKDMTYWGGKRMSKGNRKDDKLVLLHELAHHICDWREHHSPKFWDLCWELYRKYKVPIRFALSREQSYRKGAIAAYKRSK